MAWDVFGTGRTVVRGGYGLYYGHVRILGNLSEFRNYQQFSVNITNPAYPDPYGGRDPRRLHRLGRGEHHGGRQRLRAAVLESVQRRFLASDSSATTRCTSTAWSPTPITTARFSTSTPACRARATRPNTTFARVDRNQSTGSARYNALYTKFEKRFSRRHQFMVTYTYMRSRDNAPLRATSIRSSSISTGGPRTASGGMPSSPAARCCCRGTSRSARCGPVARRCRGPRPPAATSTPTASTPTSCQARRRNAGSRTLDLAAVNAYRATIGRPAIPESQLESSRINLLDMRAEQGDPVRRDQARSDGAALQRVQHDESAGAVRRRARDQRLVRCVRADSDGAARASGRARRSTRHGKETSHGSFIRQRSIAWPRCSSLAAAPAFAQPAAAQKAGLQAADIYKLRSVGDVQISPDGRTAVYSVTNNDRPDRPYSQVWLLDVTAGTSRRLGGDGDTASEPMFSPDGKHLGLHRPHPGGLRA